MRNAGTLVREGGMRRALRVLRKTLAIFGALQCALVEFALRMLFARRALPLPERTRWLQRWCRRVLKLLGVEIELRGEMPSSGLLVSNHLSYLDILVFGALAPAVFVAKMEVRGWMLIGLFARLGGAIFLDRWNFRRVEEVVSQIEAALRAGELVVAFPEATTTDGDVMLPFRPATFESAVRCGARITASHIWYTLADGSFGRSLCWFGEVQGARHLAGTFAQRRITAHMTVMSERVFDDRKRAAAETFVEVEQVHRAFNALRVREGQATDAKVAQTAAAP